MFVLMLPYALTSRKEFMPSILSNMNSHNGFCWTHKWLDLQKQQHGCMCIKKIFKPPTRTVHFDKHLLVLGYEACYY